MYTRFYLGISGVVRPLFVRQGKRVLLIDADSQHSATVSLGVKEPDKLAVSLGNVMHSIIREQDAEINPTYGIIEHSEGISLMPSNNGLAGIEVALAPIIGRETVQAVYRQGSQPL